MNETPDQTNGWITQETVITNRFGLHARTSSMLCKLASSFSAEIILEAPRSVVVGDQAIQSPDTWEKTDGKSVIGILMLATMVGAVKGTRVRIRARGADAEEAVEAIRALIDARFGEE